MTGSVSAEGTVDRVSSQGLVGKGLFPALMHGLRSLEQILAVSLQVLAGS